MSPTITELGHYALLLALGLSIVQSTLPSWGASRNDAQLMALALAPSAAAISQFIFMLLAFVAVTLTHAFVIDGNGRIFHKKVGPLSARDVEESLLPLLAELGAGS